MSVVSRAAFVNYLTNSVQVLHAEDQRLRCVLNDVKRTREVGPVEFEALIDAQQTALRIPANMLLMLASYIESVEVGPGATPPAPACGPRARLKRAMVAFFKDP